LTLTQKANLYPALDTEILIHDLRSHAARSSVFMITAHGSQFLVGMGAIIVLARLLTPADFGIMAMVVALTGFIEMVNDFGIPAATVQKKNLTQTELSRLFLWNMKLNIGLTIFMITMAPALTWFYGEPSLFSITIVLAGAIFISGIGNVHLGLLRRQMRFGIIALIEVGTLVMAIMVAIATALLGGAYWALVLQQVTVMVSKFVAVLWASGWRPSLRPGQKMERDTGSRALRSFGRDVTLSRILMFFSQDFYRILIGRVAGATTLGLYSTASRWALLPSRQLHIPMLNVVTSTFSRLQDDTMRYRNYFEKTATVVYFAVFPTLGFLFVEAREVFLLLLGDQWLEAVPLFKILVLGSIGYTANQVTKWAYLAEGRPKDMLYWNFIYAPATITGTFIGMIWGTTGVAWGYTITAISLTYPCCCFCLSGSPLKKRHMARPAVLPMAVSVIAGFITLFCQPILLPLAPLILRVLVHGMFFSITYLAIWLVVPTGFRTLKEIISFLPALKAGNPEKLKRSPHLK
jgi:PST family polysaccharide transporter